MNESAIEWTGDELGEVTLSAWDGDVCVATMRASLSPTQDCAARILGVPLPALPGAFPALVLTRAATYRDYRGSGVNSAMRYHLLSRAGGVRSVLGVVFEGAPRENRMGRIGCRFLPLSGGWTVALRPTRLGRLAVLDAAALPGAVRMLSEAAADALATFPAAACAWPLTGGADVLSGSGLPSPDNNQRPLR